MESDSILPQLLLQLVLIAVNALFAATEIAIISLNETKVRRMAEGGDRKAAKMLRMVTEPTGFLSTIQICITLAGFLGSAFAADNFSMVIIFFSSRLPQLTMTTGTGQRRAPGFNVRFAIYGFLTFCSTA